MKVLLVVDLQPEFRVEPEYSRLLKYIKLRKQDYALIISTVFCNEPDSMFVRYLNYTKCMTPSVSLDYKTDVVWGKFSYCAGASLYNYIEKMKPDVEVDVIGCNTDACVMATCFELFEHNIPFNILVDFCYSTCGKEIHDIAVRLMKLNFGTAVKVCDLDELQLYVSSIEN